MRLIARRPEGVDGMCVWTLYGEGWRLCWVDGSDNDAGCRCVLSGCGVGRAVSYELCLIYETYTIYACRVLLKVETLKMKWNR